MSYFQDIQDGIRTTLKGLSLTLKHLRNATQRRTPVGIASDNYFELQNGLVTLQYPHEQLPIPDNGRYRLYNEIDDCILCDKCAKVCPVDCITIDAIKATEEVGRASDGSPIRLYAAKFDIDMAKCCYCGLCTVVCPTECLTMEKTFDYSEFKLGKLTYHFADLTPEEADQKRALYEQFVREKEELKAQQAAAKATQAPVTSTGQPTEAVPAAKRPVFRPTAKPAATSQPEQPTGVEPVQAKSSEAESTTPPATPKRPVFKPTLKPAAKTETPAEPETPTSSGDTPEQPTETTAEAKTTVAKPEFRPSMKPKATVELPANSEDKEQKKPLEKRNSVGSALEHPVTDATPDEAGKIALEARDEAIKKGEVQQTATDTPKPRPAFRPTMKPAQSAAAKPEPLSTDQSAATPETTAADTPKPKPAFQPTMKPKAAQPNEPQASVLEQASFKPEEPTSQLGGAQEASTETAPKPKPAFRPTMKPKPKPDQTSDSPGESV